MRILPKNQDWTAYVWLIYLLYFVLAGPFDRFPVTLAGGELAGAGDFWSFWIRGPRVLWIAGAWFVLAVLFLRINPGATTFFVYAACLYGKIWRSEERRVGKQCTSRR